MSTPFVAPLQATIDGITLRSYQVGDGVAMQEAVVSSYEHLRPWLAWASTDQTIEQSEALAREFQAKYLLNQDYVLGIWVGDELAGGTGYHLREGPFAWRNAEIGMWIRASYAGQGFGTRALAAVLHWGFTEWPWERLSWRCDSLNYGSAQVARKNGLQLEGTTRGSLRTREGERRDTMIFGILREEWLARHEA